MQRTALAGRKGPPYCWRPALAGRKGPPYC
jgi:hypothetical protein